MPVKFRVADVDMDFKTTKLEDISWGGAFILWPKPFPKNTRLIVQFFLVEDSVVLEVWGTVTRIREPHDGVVGGMGVQFDNLDDAARSTIQKMVKSYLKPFLSKRQ